MKLPRPTALLQIPLRLLPGEVHSRLIAALANHFARGQKLDDRLAELDGRSVAIEISDTRTRLGFRVRAGRLAPDVAGDADVSIRGRLEDFIDLASRREDPDTLFFQRRLCIEGDTELGLQIKNMLDAIEYDWPAHVRAVLPATLAELVLAATQRFQSRRRLGVGNP